MSDTLIQRARDAVADQYIRLQVKKPQDDQLATEWAGHVERYAGFLRSGAYDDSLEVQSALSAMRGLAA